MRYRVKETTKQKDNGERPQESIQEVLESHRLDQPDGQLIKNAIRLEKEPDGEIKVYLIGKRKREYHIGYIQKVDLEEVASKLNDIVRVDAEFVVSNFERTALDENDKEYVYDKASVIDVFIHIIDVVESTKDNPFIKEGDGSTKTKITNRIGCGLLVFILLMFLIIIFI